MSPVTSSGELSATGLSATFSPRRSTTTRSATENTSGMRWLISTTAICCSRRRRIRPSTSATWRTLIAAVGSSISTIFGSDRRVRAIATAWRWPPDMRRTRSRGRVSDFSSANSSPARWNIVR
jgi:hypothetical protein